KNQNAAQAGGDLIGNLLLGGGLSRYGGMNVGEAASGAGRWMLNEFGPQAGLMFERYQYQTGLAQYAVPPEFKLGRVSGGVELGGIVLSGATTTLASIEGRFAGFSREVGFIVDSQSGQILSVRRAGLAKGAEIRLVQLETIL
ncbi:hypothetical protein HNQ59_004011, partial [Chitinivorax tropicus]